MIKFRPRGSFYHTLDKSLADMSEFETKEGMIKWIKDKTHGDCDVKIDKEIDFDERCGWNSQIVIVTMKDGYWSAIGYCDLGELR